MRGTPRTGGAARIFCVLLAELVVLQSWHLPLRAQDQQPAALTISILEGEGSVNNIRQRVAREAMVQVDDENHKPVAGVVVAFILPDSGASGVFATGTRTISVTTDSAGRALAPGIVPNDVAGNVKIRVVARYKALEAEAVINTQNVLGAAAAAGGATVGGAAGGGAAGGGAAGAGAAAGGISSKLLLIIGIAAAGVAGGVFAVTRGGGSSSSSSSPVTVTAGTPTVGAPPSSMQPRRKH